MIILKDSIIEKLIANNRHIWKFRMEMYLQKEDFYSVIINEPPDPITDAFSSKNRKALAIINLLIEDDQVIRVKNLETKREIWIALKNIHERSNLSSKLLYYENFIRENYVKEETWLII